MYCWNVLDHVRTGNIQVLESCPNLTSVNFYNCNNIQGNIQVLKSCPNLTSVDFHFCFKIEGEHTSNELS